MRRVQRKETQLWLRMLAFIIDIVILRMVLLPVISYGIGFFIKFFDEENRFLEFLKTLNQSDNILISVLVIGFIFILYCIILESSRFQSTIGKLFMRFKVSSLEHERISFTRSLSRNLLKIISILSLIGVGIIDISKKRQGLHDLIARTIVERI
ncbi:RDD family protein [Saccharicrinis aurantiacus]|uniref:RDD family protein n=1 Tax=Saccharicrinis aurantiacus TaxID=1849719 RepID=UPI0024910CB2|nr:RDD family protein [Saccharicrinis aurantiacus]